MSTGQAWWAHKNKTYLELCKEYNEEPQYSEGARGIMFLESNSKHAQELSERSSRSCFKETFNG